MEFTWKMDESSVREGEARPVERFRAQVEAARAPGAMSAAWARAWTAADKARPATIDARLLQTHYRPHGPTRLLFEGLVRTASKPMRRQYLFAQLYSSPEVAAERYSRALSKKRFLRSRGPAVFRVEEWNAVVWALPNGPRLRNLRSFLQKRAFRRFLQRVGSELEQAESDPLRPSLIRYVPRRRALLRWERTTDGEQSRFYIKIYGPGADEVAAENLALVADVASSSGGAFSTPELVVHDTHRRAIVMREVPGEPFTRRIEALDAASFAAVGRALAALHAGVVRPRARWDTGEEMVRIEHAASDLCDSFAEARTPIQELLERIRDRIAVLPAERDALIHANLFGDQILCSDERLGIVDWDDLSRGDPTFDVGRLIAHAIYVVRARGRDAAELEPCLIALLSAYEEAGGRLDVERLALHAASSLLVRAKISALRPLVQGWRERVLDSAIEADRLLTRDPGWLRAARSKWTP